jgi:hypothetical protein
MKGTAVEKLLATCVSNIIPKYVTFFFSWLLQSLLCGPFAFLNGLLDPHTHLVGLLGRGISPTQGLYLHRTTQHRKTQTHIHAPSRIQTCDLNVRAAEDSTCLRPLGHWDRHVTLHILNKISFSAQLIILNYSYSGSKTERMWRHTSGLTWCIRLADTK